MGPAAAGRDAYCPVSDMHKGGGPYPTRHLVLEVWTNGVIQHGRMTTSVKVRCYVDFMHSPLCSVLDMHILGEAPSPAHCYKVVDLWHHPTLEPDAACGCPYACACLSLFKHFPSPVVGEFPDDWVGRWRVDSTLS